MDDFPGNSRRFAEQQKPTRPTTPPAEKEEPKLQPVIAGKVIRRKKTLGRRFMDTFFSSEGGVFMYLVREVLVPAVRDTATDFIIQGIEKAAYGEVRSARRTGYRPASGPRTHVSYNNPSSIVRSPLNSSVPTPMRRPSAPQQTIDLQEIIVDSKTTAEIILEKMYETIEEYQAVTVANLKELLNETAVYTDHRWGWTEDSDFATKRVRDGWLLILPDPIDLR